MPTFFGGKVNTKIKGPLPADWWEERKEKKMIPTAEEARERTNKWITLKRQAEMEKIEKEIEREIENGHHIAYCTWRIDTEIKEKLEELGYTVTLGSQYNESWTSIEW